MTPALQCPGLCLVSFILRKLDFTPWACIFYQRRLSSHPGCRPRLAPFRQFSVSSEDKSSLAHLSYKRLPEHPQLITGELAPPSLRSP